MAALQDLSTTPREHIAHSEREHAASRKRAFAGRTMSAAVRSTRKMTADVVLWLAVLALLALFPFVHPRARSR